MRTCVSKSVSSSCQPRSPFLFPSTLSPLIFPVRSLFALTLEFPSSRATRYISLRSSRDHDAFLVPFQFHETKGLDVQEKHFSIPARNSFRITFRKKGGEKDDTFGGSGPKEKKRGYPLFSEIYIVPFFRRKDS